MVVSKEPNINNIMGGIENTGGVRLHNHKKKLKQRFDIIKKLGQGTYGKVQLGINKETGQEVAIKTIKKSKIETEADLIRIRREIQIMSSVQHPNIIHIYEVFENREKMILVMEYAAGGELYDYLSERKVLSEEEARRIFRQIAIACYYCHKHKICHRDLKLENILLDENGNAKIADFGLSNIFDDQRLLSTYCGSPLYASPEIVKGTPYQGPEVDCWSLGVLLYTLVYGAMPFDGSNFKRLVKQISQGDYFEPKKPSRASPLIREMLTVNPLYRASVQQICSHWWVNESFEENCLDVSEELANQTPVRLDLLLSLAPPAPQLESEKLMVTGESGEPSMTSENMTPTRSQSVGSLLELSHPTELRDLIPEKDAKGSTKRKLDTVVSTDQANQHKDKIIKEKTVADVTAGQASAQVSEKTNATVPLDKSATRTINKTMEVDEEPSVAIDPSTMGAVCAEIIEEAQKTEEKKVKSSVKESTKDKSKQVKDVENKDDKKDVQVGKENDKTRKVEIEGEKSKIPAKKRVIKKKVLTDKNENLIPSNEEKKDTNEKIKTEKSPEENEEEKKSNKPIERRRSKVFETAEKFQNTITSNEKNINEKPKKIIIPGVSVGGFRKEFERKASLTSSSNVPQIKSQKSKKEVQKSEDTNSSSSSDPNATSVSTATKSTEELMQPESHEQKENDNESVKADDNVTKVEEERKKKAVSIISTALDKEGTRKSKSKPCVGRKPPIPFGSSGRSVSENIGIITEQNNIMKEINELPLNKQAEDNENKISSAEITLKSATLPRRKTAKAEISLKYPTPKPAVIEFKTEMAHNVEASNNLPTTIKSEATFPVSAPANIANERSSSQDTLIKSNQSRERIIPISFEKEGNTAGKPPARVYQTQRSLVSQKSDSLSRQSTIESDSDNTSVTGEPIRKSPREFIIPIAVEGGGYITPRAGSLEPSEVGSGSTLMSRSKFGRARRMSSLLNEKEGSEDESGLLPRRNSFGKDSDNEDSRKDLFRMHSLRSSRPRKINLDHNDSFSSGEDDDDEDGFEILTAENLFSTLLSRVRDLTSRLNVDDAHPGLPRGSLLSRNLLNFPNRFEALSRRSPFGRTFNREKNSNSTSGMTTPTWHRSIVQDHSRPDARNLNSSESLSHTATLPRGDKFQTGNLNLLDLDLKKLLLSKEDALALSYLTPGLSRRIQKQLLSQLSPSTVKKLSRTMSMQEAPSCSTENSLRSNREYRKSVDNVPFDRDRKFIPRESSLNRKNNLETDIDRPVRISSRTKINELSLPSFYRERSPSVAKTEDLTSENESSPLENYRRRSGLRTRSLREPTSSYLLPSTTQFTTDSATHNNDSAYKVNRLLSPSRYDLPDSKEIVDKETKKSRFLRPGFYDSQDEETIRNPYLREKKERELETQKVLKEIRDKRKSKMRERSADRHRLSPLNANVEQDLFSNGSPNEIDDKLKFSSNNKSTENLLKNVSDNIKNLELNVQKIHDYVNLSPIELDSDTKLDNCRVSPVKNKLIHDYVNLEAAEIKDTLQDNVVPKQERISKIARPKSYPTESKIKKFSTKIPTVNSRNESKTRTSPTNKSENITENRESPLKEEKPSTKNKLLHSLEKKIEKLRSFNNNSSPESQTPEDKAKKSNIEKKIRKLRELSVPADADPSCITESGLIKRAVSVEDFPSLGNTAQSNNLQASKKSVTKILNLFKKYEDNKNKIDKQKNKKSKDKRTSESEAVLLNKTNVSDESSNDISVSVSDVIPKSTYKEVMKNERSDSEPSESLTGVDNKPERPRSLLLERMKRFQNPYSGAKSDSLVLNEKSDKKTSKLPVNTFRRSLNLENSFVEPEKQLEDYNNSNVSDVKPNRRKLHLNLSKDLDQNIPDIYIDKETTSTEESNAGENKNSLARDNSFYLSPCEDYSLANDSWSICSDYNTHDIVSPVSPTGQFYSADEGESVEDRIRRKSFYSRFNEKKRPRKSTISNGTLNYNDLHTYKNLGFSNPGYKSPTAGNYFSSSKKTSNRKSSHLPEPLNLNEQVQSNSNPRYSAYAYSPFHPNVGKNSCMSNREVHSKSKSPVAGKSKI